MIVYIVILFLYFILEKIFLLKDLYNSVNKILIILLIAGIIYHIYSKYDDLFQSLYWRNMVIHLFQTLINILIVFLLYRNLVKLHRKQIKELQTYPTLQKAAHIRLLEKKTKKNNQMDERKKIREQLEQKYLDDLKKLNSNR